MKQLTVNDYIEQKLTHSIHTSERRSFRACRRRWDWLFREHIYPVTTAKPLEFGQALHKAMETWYDPMTWDKDPETRETLAILAFNRSCQGHKAEYLANNEGAIDPGVEEDFKERRDLGEGMIRYHCQKVSPRVDVGFKPVQVEIDFEVPVLSPTGDQLWCKCDNCWNMFFKYISGKKPPAEDEHFIAHQINKATRERWEGLPVTYGGRIDMLGEDETGGYWVFDWKTAARLSGQEEQESPDEFILLDDQITSYVWALWTLGINVRGFVYHEMKKAFPVEPEPNKVQRKGCWYSVNKMQSTSYDLYLETVSEGDAYGLASGAYDEFLAWLKEEGPKYYSRKQVMRNEAELRNAGYHIYLEALDMIDPGLRIYPSPGRYGCTFCAFRQPCIGSNRDEDVDYMLETNFVRRAHRYWELNKSSTESKGGV